MVVLAPTGAVLARHRLNPGPGSTNVYRERYQGPREQPGSSKSRLGRVFQQRFPEERAGRFLGKLLAQYKFNATFQSRRILALVASYPRAAMPRAFEQALQYNTFSCRFPRGILSRRESAIDLPEPTLFGQERVLPGLEITRGLHGYQTPLDEAPHD